MGIQVDLVVEYRAADVTLELLHGSVLDFVVPGGRACGGANEAALHALALATRQLDNSFKLIVTGGGEDFLGVVLIKLCKCSLKLYCPVNLS